MTTQDLTPRGLTWTWTKKRLTAETFGKPAAELVMHCKIGWLENGAWQKEPVTALWDTGTSMTIISPSVARKLHLPSLEDTITLNGVKGTSEAEVYAARVILPNGKAYGPIAVAVQDLPSTDVLLGMDVISSGTFSIRRKPDGGTLFTFDLNV